MRIDHSRHDKLRARVIIPTLSQPEFRKRSRSLRRIPDQSELPLIDMQ
jgi:hypothetical protein